MAYIKSGRSNNSSWANGRRAGSFHTETFFTLGKHSPFATMSEHLKDLSDQLTRDLGLTHPPVQVSYVDGPPAGLVEHAGGAPSVCTFFAEGTKGPFFAGLPAHASCEVGAFVLGMLPEGELGSRLNGTIEMMQREGYLAPGEEARIPRNSAPPKYVAYGPLGSVPVTPTTILLFASPRSAMLAFEAAGSNVPINGRPMCAINPILDQGAPVAMSFGCIGSRVFTQMSDGEMVVGVRGDYLEQFAQTVSRLRAANDVIAAEDRRRRDAANHPFQGPMPAAGQRSSIGEPRHSVLSTLGADAEPATGSSSDSARR